jgi:A/G-specific adenine glycosylase
MPTSLGACLDDPVFRSWLRRRLLAWFTRHARDLPWRRTRDSYAIWISEVMLQQTQVAAVIPYFHRFLAAFPDVAALAAAKERDVLRLWEGLGYYRRARALHHGARRLVAESAGRIPDDPQFLARLPGLGRYTVNAILSQAFERPVPILEANSRRVLCRLLGIRADPAKREVEQFLWEAAARLLPAKRVGAFNQALMELGALVCTPARPGCGRCPLARKCLANIHSWQSELPVKGSVPRIEEVREVTVALWRKRRVLIVQRSDQGRWGGMWELPRRQLGPREVHEDAAASLLAELGLTAEIGPELTTIRHGVTRFRITLVCLQSCYQRGRFQKGEYVAGRWILPADLASYPLSRPQRRIAEMLCHPQPARLF